MTEAVIVSTARTPIGRAFKGSLKDVRPDDLSVQVIRAALDKVPGLDPALVEDLYWGCAEPSGRHGSNMARGMEAVVAAVQATPPADAAALFKTVGMTLVSTVGGASGPLYGTFFLRLGGAAGAAAELDAAALGAALRAGAEGVRTRGKAPGYSRWMNCTRPSRSAQRRSKASPELRALTSTRTCMQRSLVSDTCTTHTRWSHSGKASHWRRASWRMASTGRE